MQVLHLIILWSIKETNLDEKKKLNSKLVIASKLPTSWHIATLLRTLESTWIFITRNDVLRTNLFLGNSL